MPQGKLGQARAILSRHGTAGLAARIGLRLLGPAGSDAREWRGDPVRLDLNGRRGPETARRVAAVFVTFHPDDEFPRRLAVTAEQVDHVYVVDNTPGDSSAADDAPCRATPGSTTPGGPVEVIRNGQNLGVATALNQGAQRAIADGYDVLLLMDQDSSPRPGMVGLLESALRRWPAHAAIASPRHVNPNLPASASSPDGRGLVRSMLATMTAGSLLDLRAYEVLGRFRDDLFIDQVDHEYCLRAHRKGYDVVQVDEALIDHCLGDPSVRNIAGSSIVTSNHSPLRRYYIVRNRLIVARDYPDFPAYRRVERSQTLRELRDILLFEDQKPAKLRMAARGLWDYWRRRTGPL